MGKFLVRGSIVNVSFLSNSIECCYNVLFLEFRVFGVLKVVRSFMFKVLCYFSYLSREFLKYIIYFFFFDESLLVMVEISLYWVYGIYI